MSDNLTLETITTLGAGSAITNLNSNFTAIADKFDEVLYKDGHEELVGDLDANSQRIYNLPAPLTSSEPVRLGDISQLAKGDPGADTSAFGLITSLSAMSIPDGVDLIQSTGFSTVGKGAAKYVRTATPSANEQAAGLNIWLFRSNGNTVWWRLAEEAPTDLMFGVVADASLSYSGTVTTVTGTDDTTALQAAVNYIVYFSPNTKRLLLPQNCLRKITNTIHVAYGNTFESWTIEGDSRGFDSGSQPNKITGIYFTANDRPCFNTQGARRGLFRNLSIVGVNHNWLWDKFTSINEWSNKANWRGPEVRPTSVDTSKSPCCGIAIDGYSGTAPANPYPTVTYPTWSGVSGQYGKNFSSSVTCEGVIVSGFEVGVAVQPNAMASASQGDFIRWNDCDLSLNEVAVVVAHRDARVVSFHNTMAHYCHTVLDSVSYGTGMGNVATLFSGCSFDNCYQILYTNLSVNDVQWFSPTIILDNCYCESTYKLGVVRTTTASGRAGTVIIRGGEYNFYNGSARLAVMFTPKWYLDGLGQVRLEVIGTTFGGTFGAFPVNCDVIRFEASFPTIAWDVFSPADLGGRRALSTMCYMWAPKCSEAAIRSYMIFDYTGNPFYGILTKSTDWDMTAEGSISVTGSGNRGMPIPWFVKTVDFKGQRHAIPKITKQVLNRASYSLSGLSTSGRESTFTFSMDFLGNPGFNDPDYHIGVGDIVQDDNDGRLGYIKTYSKSGTGAGQTITLTVCWVTGINTTTGTVFTSDANPSTSSGTLSFYASRRGILGLTKKLIMSTTSGSGTFSLVQPGAETFPANELGAGFIWCVNVNDYLLGGNDIASIDDSTFPPYSKITAIAWSAGAPTGSITVNQNARRTGVFNAPLTMRI